MRRLSSTALLLAGLGLLSAAGVLSMTAPLPQEKSRPGGIDRLPDDQSGPFTGTDAGPGISEPPPSRGSPAPSAGPGPGTASPPVPSIPSRPTQDRPGPGDPAAEELYRVDAATLRRAIEEIEQALVPMMPQVIAAASGPPGGGLRVSSDAGAATLDSQGFTVTDLRLSESFGLQVGDTVVSVNGHRVEGPQSAWWIFQNLFVRNRGLTELQLEIHRSGTRLYKTYQIVSQY